MPKQGAYIQHAVFPNIRYCYQGLARQPTKSGAPEYHAQFEISVFSKDYGEGKALAEAARAALIGTTVTDDDGELYISDTKLVDYSGFFDGEAFCHILTIQVKTKPI